MNNETLLGGCLSKILIIDDAEAIRETMKEILEEYNFSVFTAENGIDGLKKAGQITPDIIISDLFMPEKDGFEVVKEYRNQSEDSGIIIISGFGVPDTNSAFLNMAKQMGADAVLSKPIDYTLLLDNINKLLAS